MTDDLEKYEEPLAAEYESLSRETLEYRLTLFIKELLQNDFAKLTNMIYRHDVNEHKFNIALEEPTVDMQARAVALLVIERELQKIETRKKYSRKNNPTLPPIS